MITAHLLDSLAVHSYIKGPRVLDVGSGAGLPGIPLAVIQSTTEFVLVESNAKKTRFLHQVSYELPLTNIRVERTRIEDYPGQVSFDTVMCRAFGRLSEFVAAAGKYCKHSGRMLALKGRFPEIELACIPSGFKVERVYKLKVPYLEQHRHVVEIMRI
jgi:16S rRNA (guanine527-N7)-methyltransferase